MFNLTASLVPLAQKTIVQKLMPGVDGEGLKMSLVMLSVLNLAMLELLLDLSPNPLPLAQIPCILMIQVTLCFCSICLCSGLTYAVYRLWCQLGYKGECGSGACGDCRLGVGK